MAELRSPLYERLEAAGARPGADGGVLTAAAFGDVAREFQALLGACGVFDLASRGKILATGGDRQRWLNGMVTNNVRDLAQNHGNYNFLLNAQGRIVGDMFVYHRGEYMLIETARDQVEKVATTLDRYIIMDDVELTDASEQIAAIGVAGPQAASVLAQAGFDVNGLAELEVRDTWMGEAGISLVRTAADAYQVWMSPANAPAVWEALTAAGATPVGSEALELLRIYQGVPRYGRDIRDRDLPQETAQAHALNFSKGCYIGQEIVERIRARGQVHRMFAGFVFETDPPAPGTKIIANGKEAGEVTSSATLPLPEGPLHVGLGYARRELAPAGTAMEAGEARGVVTALPFVAAGGAAQVQNR